MKDFEYVKILTDDEIKNHILRFKSISNFHSLRSNNYLKANKNILINEYEKYEKELLKIYSDELAKFNQKIELWKHKKCHCGSKLYFNSSYGFWGCNDFRNAKKEHLTFQANQGDTFKIQAHHVRVRLSQNWSTLVLKRCNFQGIIKAKELLLFYDSVGLPDLREKYGYKNSVDSISGFVNANRESKKEEKIIRDFLSTFFEKIRSQIYIKFKQRDKPEQLRIVDLIVSDTNTVYLIEVKRHNIYIEEDQLELYYDLIKYVMDSKQDQRKLKSLFIVNDYYENDYNFNQCVVFNDLKTRTEKSQIVNDFNMKLYK